MTGSGGNGTLTVQHPGAKFTYGGTTCEYEASKASISVTGGNPGEYEVTSPNPLFIVSG